MNSCSNKSLSEGSNADPDATMNACLSTSETSSLKNLSLVDFAQLIESDGTYTLPTSSQSTTNSTTRLGTSGSAHTSIGSQYNEGPTQPVSYQECNLAVSSPQQQHDYANFYTRNTPIPARTLSSSIIQDCSSEIGSVNINCNNNEQVPANSTQNTPEKTSMNTDIVLQSKPQSSRILFKCIPKLLKEQNEDKSKQRKIKHFGLQPLEYPSIAMCIDASAVGETIDAQCWYGCNLCHENYETDEEVSLHLENVHQTSPTSSNDLMYSLLLKCNKCC